MLGFPLITVRQMKAETKNSGHWFTYFFVHITYLLNKQNDNVF